MMGFGIKILKADDSSNVACQALRLIGNLCADDGRHSILESVYLWPDC